MNRVFWALSAVILLSGCTEKLHFHQDGRSEQTFRRDEYECERDADLRSREPVVAGGYGVLAQSADRFSAKMQREERRTQLMISCMSARGWRQASTPG